MTETKTAYPIIQAGDDEGYGFDVIFRNPRGNTILLEAKGASIRQDDQGVTTIYVKSEHRDFEGDYLYLLLAEVYVTKTTWIGSWCEMRGAMKAFLYRTEEGAAADLADTPGGDGCYMPSGPKPGDDPFSDADTAEMTLISVEIHGRGAA